MHRASAKDADTGSIVLLDLASREKRVELACRVASEDAGGPRRDLLRSLARQYAIFASELRARAVDERAIPLTPSSRVRMGWHELLDVHPERTLTQALAVCRAREHEVVDAYRAALRCEWPDPVRDALARHLRVHVAAAFELVEGRGTFRVIR